MSLAAYWTPYALDNHLFEAGFLRNCPGGFTWTGFFNYADAIRQVDNWRLPNILAPVVSLYAPKWLFAVITGLAVALCCYAAAYFSGGNADSGRTHHPRITADYMCLVFAAMLIFLPWGNNLLTGDYAMNYLWGGAIALSMLLAAQAGVERKFGCVLPAVLGIVLGIWHEGMALATVAGIFLMALCCRFDRRYIPYYIGGIVALVVTLVWMLCSHLTERASDEIRGAALIYDPLRFLRYNFPAVVLFGFVVFMFAVKRRTVLEFIQARPLVSLFGGTSIAALALAAVTAFSGRAAFWGGLTAIVAFGIIPEPFMVRHFKRTVAVAVGLVCIVFCTAELLFCKAFGERYDAFVENLAKSHDGTVYGPVFLPQDFPAWLPQFVPKNLFVEPFTYRALSDRFDLPEAALVPVEFGFIEFRNDASKPVVTADNHMYMSAQPDISAPVVVDNPDGTRCFLLPFNSRQGPMICVYPIE